MGYIWGHKTQFSTKSFTTVCPLTKNPIMALPVLIHILKIVFFCLLFCWRGELLSGLKLWLSTFYIICTHFKPFLLRESKLVIFYFMWWFDCVCVVFLISLDKDECATREAKCPRYSTCVNTDGSYRCQCESGRILNNNKCDGMITSLKLPACVLKRKKHPNKHLFFC